MNADTLGIEINCKLGTKIQRNYKKLGIEKNFQLEKITNYKKFGVNCELGKIVN